MDVYEQCVMRFLTVNGTSFISPQLNIPYLSDIDSGGSLPDFVVIRPGLKECWIVEVTATGSIRGLASKFATAEKQWLRALRKTMIQNAIADTTWSFSMLAFVRTDKLKEFKRFTSGIDDLAVWPLEFTFEHWKWPPMVRSPEFDFRNNQIASIS